MRKISFKEICKYVEDLGIGYKIISPESDYKSTYVNIMMRCDKGHEYSVRISNFKTGKRCPVCAIDKRGQSQKLTIEYVRQKIEEAGYKLLSTEYKNAYSKLEIECDKGHTYKQQWGSFSVGHRCSVCGSIESIKKRTFTIERVKERTKTIAPEYELLSTEYVGNNTKLDFLCPDNHKFSMTWANFSRGQKCPVCANVIRGEKRKTVTIEFVKEYVAKYGYKLISTEFVSALTYLELICDKGHEVSISWCNFKKGHRCKYCSLDGRTKYKSSTERDNYHSYREFIERLSNSNYCEYYYQINPDKLERAYDKYHLDHIYSIIDGFENGIPAEVLANPNNLQMLWYTDNITKHGRSDATVDELYSGYNNNLNRIHTKQV